MKVTTLIGIAAIAYAAGYRTEDRKALGLLLSAEDHDLDIICNYLTQWEVEGK